MDRGPWEALFVQLEREAEATADADRVGSLSARLAHLHWDLLDAPDAAQTWLLRGGEAHSHALELRRELMMAQSDVAGAVTLLEGAALRAERPDLALAFVREAGLLRLLRLGDPAGAARVLQATGLENALDPPLTDLLELCLAVADDEQALVDRGAAAQTTATSLIVAGLLLWDRRRQGAEARALLTRAHLLDETDPFVLELLLEIAGCSSRDEGHASLLKKKLALISRQTPQSAEARAISFDLARLMERMGQAAEAAALLDGMALAPEDGETTDPGAASAPTWAGHLVLFARRDVAARMGDVAGLARAYLGLAEASRSPAMSRAYRLRAAQLLDLAPETQDQVEALLSRNFDENPADPHSARTLERFRLRHGRMAHLCAQYEQQAAANPQAKGMVLRKAALVAEAYLNDTTLSASFRRDSLAAQPDPVGHGELQRLYRCMRSDARLIEAYRREAETTADPARAALLVSAIAVVRLKLGQLDEAAAAAAEALELCPDDSLALAVLGWVYRAVSRDSELAALLLRQAEALQSPANRAASYRQLAALLQDAEEARGLLERALLEQPGDPSTLFELVLFCERTGRFSDATRFGLELAQACSSEPARAVEILLRVGSTFREHLGDSAQAAECYRRALALKPDCLPALRELARVHQEQGDNEALLECLPRLFAVEPEAAARAALMLEHARTMEAAGRELEEVLEAYVAAARTESARTEALTELERVCRESRRLDVLVSVVRDAPESTAALGLLARVLEESGDLQALGDVLARLIDLSSSELEKADRRYELGRTLEARGQPDLAAAQYEQVVAGMRGHRPALRALERIYRAAGDLNALERLFRLELDVFTEVTTRAEVLLDLARLLSDDLRTEEAAQCLEDLLVLQPDSLDALTALQHIYESTDPLALAGVIRQRAGVETDPVEKSRLFLRSADLLARHGVEDEAGEVLRLASASDPGNREAFTAYERFLLLRERHHDLMDLYTRAIRYVETEGGRAYRPVDLHTRRAQLQLKHLGQPGEAAASCLRALEHDPKSEIAMKTLEAILLQQQDWLGLVRAYEHRADLVPHNELFRLESLRQAARLATSRLPAQPEEAERLWEKIWALDPIDEEALDQLEAIYERQERTAKLVNIIEHRVALAPRDETRIDLCLRAAELSERVLEDPERAARAYEGVRQIHPHHESALRALARIYEATSQWNKCLEVLSDWVIMEADPDERSLLYFRCGSIAESRFGDDEQAIRHYEAAISENSGCVPALHGLRDLYLRKQEWNRALDTLELEFRLWTEQREQAGVLTRMGEIRLRHLADVRKAMEHFEDALTLDPECYPAALALYDLYFDRGDRDKALAVAEPLVLRMAKEGDPEVRSRFYSRHGQLLAGAGQLHAAVESLVVALELRPRNLEALDWLIALCRRDPEAYDFATIFRDLEQAYRREGDAAAVGHVLVAAGALSEIAGDAETALARYREAMQAAPQDLTPVRSLADLLVGLRRVEEAISELRRFADGVVDRPAKLKALLRLGEVFSNIAPDPQRAMQVYTEMLELDPGHTEASYRLAQEHYAVGRYETAERVMRTLVDGALSRSVVRPEVLSEYVHYLGVILLQRGQLAEGEEQFRRALQLDAGNGAAAMSLARHLGLTGDRQGAIRLLNRTIHVLRDKPGKTVVLDLWRSLAGLSLGAGDFDAALTCFESVVREGERPEDRIALAEVCAQMPQGVTRALAALAPVMEADALNLHALRLMGELFELSGEPERAVHALKVVDALGGAEEEDRFRVDLLSRQFSLPLTGVLNGNLRRHLVVAQGERFVDDVWLAVRESLERLFFHDLSRGTLRPLAQTASPDLLQVADFCIRLSSVTASVMVADAVPGGAVVDREKDRIVLDSALLQRPSAEFAFAVARSLEYLRSGYALLSGLAFDDRLLLVDLLGGLLDASGSGNDLVQEFRRGLARKAAAQVDSVVAAYRAHLGGRGESADASRWIKEIDQSASNHGLLACDDIGAALRMIAELDGQALGLGPSSEISVPPISEKPELIRFYLSEEYVELKRRLSSRGS